MERGQRHRRRAERKTRVSDISVINGQMCNQWTGVALSNCIQSETFSMHIGGPVLLVFLFVDEHGVEAAEGSQNGPAHPGRELPLRRVEHVDLHGGGGEGDHLLLQSLLKVLEHTSAPCDHYVPVEVLTNVRVTL